MCFYCDYSCCSVESTDNPESGNWLIFGPYIILALTFTIQFIVYKWIQFVKRKKQEKLLLVCLDENIAWLKLFVESLKLTSEQFKDIDGDEYSMKHTDFTLDNIGELMNIETYQLISLSTLEKDIEVFSKLKSTIRNVSQNSNVLYGKRETFINTITKKRVEFSDALASAREIKYFQLPHEWGRLNNQNPKFGPLLSEFFRIEVKWVEKLKNEQNTETPTWPRSLAVAFAKEQIEFIYKNELMVQSPIFLQYFILLRKVVESFNDFQTIQNSISDEFAFYANLFEKYYVSLLLCREKLNT